MKTLNTIQKLSKIGKALSKIVFIACLICIIGCIVGFVGLMMAPGDIELGSVTIHGMIEDSSEINIVTCYASMAVAIIMCSGEAVLAKLAEKYFKNELAAGTPFTLDGAKEMRRLGICTICIPIGTAMLSVIAYEIIKYFFNDVADLQIGDSLSIGLGVMFIVMSLICRYGAETIQGKAPEAETDSDKKTE